jgi:glutamate dehydrogenase/leucine dehydrogenase
VALFFDLIRRRKSVLKSANEADRVCEQSLELQHQARQQALEAESATGRSQVSSLSATSPEDIALLCALDKVIQTRNILNVSTKF